MGQGIVAIDIDGTLLNSRGEVSLRNREALRLAEDAGYHIVIATGRRHCYAMRVVRGLDIALSSALVSSNGTVIRTVDSQLLHRTHMPAEIALWLCDKLESFRSTMMFTFDKVGPTGEDTRGALVCESMEELNANIGRWMETNEPYIQCVPRIEAALAGPAPIQMMLCGPIARMAEAEARLLEHPTVVAVGAEERPDSRIVLHRTIYPEKDLSIVDILPAGCSKASALAHLAKIYGVAAQEIIAIGDNWNDLPMLKLAGHAVLMANAPDDLRKVAEDEGWCIAPSNDDDGVAAAIEDALENQFA